MASWIIDVRLHSVSGLPARDGSVELRLQCGGSEQRCAAASSLEGTAFIGSWARLAVGEGPQLVGVQVLYRKTRAWLLPSRQRLAAGGTLEVECGGGAASEWREVELELHFAASPTDVVGEEVRKALEKAEGADVEQGPPGAASAGAGASNGGKHDSPADDDEAEDDAVTPNLLRLRLSYRTVPAAAVAAAPAVGVPECGGEPVETATTPLPRQAHCYAHGGFMGLAVSLMGEEQWRGILEQQDPEAYKKAHKLYTRLLHKDKRPGKRLGRLMTVLENSPVLCAYGLVRSGCTAPVASAGPAAGGKDAAALTAAALPLAPELSGSRSLPAEPTVAADGEALPAEEEAAAVEPVAQELTAVAGEALPPAAEEPVAAAPAPKEAVAAAPASEVLSAEELVAAAAPSPQKMAAAAGEAPEEDTLAGVTLTRSGRQGEEGQRLKAYLASLRAPNRYGYLPIGLEWDLWIHPRKPALLQHATVDHGTSGQLVTQAVTTSMPCLRPLAQQAGVRQIEKFGVSPVDWLNQLGHSVNLAVHGSEEAPLGLRGEEEQFYRLHLAVVGVQGGVVSRQELWDHLYSRASIDAAAVVVPAHMTKSGRVGPEGCRWEHAMSFWPLPLGLERTDLLVEVRGNPAGPRRDKAVGMVRLPLRRLLRQHPALATAEGVELELPIGPKQQRRIHQQQPGSGAQQEGLKLKPATSGRGEDEEEGPDSDDEPDDSDSEQGAEDGADGAASEVERGRVTLRLRLEAVGVLEAAKSIGVTVAAAQTCVAMLSKPGGLYLDIKSAYSTAHDIQLFVTTLAGVGVHCKAVCSFQPRQLAVGGLADTVLFFHGISGLENACDDGLIEKGQFVLFNGASFLADLGPAALKTLPAKNAKAAMSHASSYPIDPFALRKYIGLCETVGMAGGIYVQEPDASPASVSALAQLVSDYSRYFPLGFAYGHLSGLGINFPDSNGRGFAAQQLVEEFQARKELSKKVVQRIKKGEHRGATLATIIAWGHRILYGSPLMGLAEQRTFILLLAQIWPHKNVAKVVDELGGIPRIVLRYFEHYELTTPLTLLEAGFNFNHTKDVLRLLRNRGVIAAMPVEEKAELAKFFCSRQLRGYGLTWVLMLLTLRRGLHKFGKEGLLCVLESCTQEEYEQVLLSLGGRKRVEGRLRGRLYISWHYTDRLADVERTHTEDPRKLAYQNLDLRYSALAGGVNSFTRADAGVGQLDACHMRDKTLGEQAWRATRKAGCCGFTLGYTFILTLATCFTFACCCVGPRVCGGAARSVLGMSALLAFILFVVLVVCLILFVPWPLGDDTLHCADPATYAAYICSCNATFAATNRCCNATYFSDNPCCGQDYYDANQAACEGWEATRGW